MDVPWRGIEVVLHLSQAEVAELYDRAEGVGLPVDDTVTALLRSVLRSDG